MRNDKKTHGLCVVRLLVLLVLLVLVLVLVLGICNAWCLGDPRWLAHSSHMTEC